MRDDWEIQDEELLEDGETKEDLVQALEEAGHAYVSIDGLSYHIALRGEGLPLICLHGFAEDSSTWDKLDVRGFRIMAIDFLGHGYSDRPKNPEAYELRTVLRHLYLLIQTLVNDEPFGILGYSMGGRMAMQYIVSYKPETLMFLIAESASPGIQNYDERMERRQSDEALAKKIESHSAEWFADFWAQVPIFESQKALPEAVQHTIWERRASNEPYVLANTLRGTGQGQTPYVAKDLLHLSIEILYIAGSLDTKYAHIGRTIFDHENAVVHVVEGAGHNVHVEKPKEFNEILALFLNDYDERRIS